MSDWALKRFWTEVTISKGEAGYAVLLDGRGVKTPGKRALAMPTEAMAEAVAAEWDAQEGEVDPLTMPATRTVNAAIDKVAVQHDAVADMLADYGDSDLLCYRADSPQSLVARQAAAWDPMLDWAAEVLQARLELRTGVMHLGQPHEALARLRELTRALGDFELAAFHDLVSLSGSLILGFAAARRAREAEEIWDLSRLDENWQIEQWGHDEEADAQTALKRADFLHAAKMFRLCSVLTD